MCSGGHYVQCAVKDIMCSVQWRTLCQCAVHGIKSIRPPNSAHSAVTAMSCPYAELQCFMQQFPLFFHLPPQKYILLVLIFLPRIHRLTLRAIIYYVSNLGDEYIPTLIKSIIIFT